MEKAAEAISFFLSCKLTDYTIIREARRYKKDSQEGGFDYWLGYTEGSKRYKKGEPIQVKIEISGIDIEDSSNTLDRRVDEKKDQILKYNSPAEPLYVSVVVFSPLKAFFGRV